jgi:phosphoribosylanthranilate isomerase
VIRPILLIATVKICCITSINDAASAVAAGADALGFVSQMPSGPGVIRDEIIRAIVATVPRHIDTFLLTNKTDAESIASQARDCGVSTLQLVIAVAPEVHRQLAETLPNVRRVQVIHVEDRSAISMIARYESFVDAFLLDSGKPSATTPILGGTGTAHDWAVSAAFVAATTRPVFLAGGLNSNNVGAAIQRVQPHGIDVCSGVRTHDALDAVKLSAFITAARGSMIKPLHSND